MKTIDEIRHELKAFHQVTCVAVSKGQSLEKMQSVFEQGQHHFAENYLQEALEKQSRWQSTELQWHFIGRLQSNKVRKVAEHFSWVQTITTLKQVERLARFRLKHDPKLNCLIQVTSPVIGHDYGLDFNDIWPVVKAIQEESSLAMRGLMAMPPPGLVVEELRAFYIGVAAFFELHREKQRWDTLSMGMSADYQIALQSGANMIRLGQVLFGPRVGSHV